MSCFPARDSHAGILTLKSGDLAFKKSGPLAFLKKKKEKEKEKAGAGRRKKRNGIRPELPPPTAAAGGVFRPLLGGQCASVNVTQTPDTGEASAT